MTQSIHLLDRSVYSKLQSQQYNVSLTSAVRELLQNSVDAGASEVQVVIDFSSWKFSVRDNGSGISCRDLDHLGCPNFTSKIASLDDLPSLRTYGFRGEAIHFISKVSNLTVTSKVHDYNSAWLRRIPGTAAVMFEPSVHDVCEDDNFKIKPFRKEESGTLVLVEDMLYNLPVRKEYLSTEPLFRQILTLKSDVLQILIKHPSVKITVSQVKKDTTEVITKPFLLQDMEGEPPTTLYSQLLRHIFGPVIPPNMFKNISIDFNEFSLKGVISKCPVKDKNLQFIFINGRNYNNNKFMKKINEIFRTSSFGQKAVMETTVKYVGNPYKFYPTFIIDIICPQTIDDLVQDFTKTIFKPSHFQTLQALILKAFKSFLKVQGYLTEDHIATKKEGFLNDSLTKEPPSFQFCIRESKIRYAKKSSITSITSARHKIFKASHERGSNEIHFPLGQVEEGPDENGQPVTSNHSCWLDIPRFTEQNEQVDVCISREQLKASTVINQVDDKFILLKTPESADNPARHSLIILDQHACDERIKLEIYLQEFVSNVIGQTLHLQKINSSCIPVSPLEYSMFKHYTNELKLWGVHYKLNDDNSIDIETLPDVLVDKVNGDRKFLKSGLVQHMNDLNQFTKLPLSNLKMNYETRNDLTWWKYISSVPTVIIEIFNSKACRSAIMFGDKLSKTEAELLLKQLINCYLPFQCAHGRPSVAPLARLQGEDEFLTTPKDTSLEDYQLS
ncbi:mismatch repair protein MLH3 KNAG_0J01790 [Huiozyma naganishii CBS 8797]|uniref:MutL C-terminal dimerisation domain-containing protein n=1 Tax=Huiozyma naganishii (strain ATCC MYA-139 / BCRC 22969 / CBS 8797 / KCTC 17520 / NBRC 10181 / NCYC 3082 / Yp74L-3) TaxID=1071383 RepID=J7RBK0_HUIN7|nr:hypothetical protein KNAG_0J01790 [Kazachstania naganishii CBS 8797]CCK72260.1 hypothetical protein KNAG_0J01790 [Kazachstania naganishii CBS 8797]